MLSAAQLRAELRRLQEIVAARLGRSDLRERIEEVIAEMDRRSGGAAHDAIVHQGTGVGGITGHSCETRTP